MTWQVVAVVVGLLGVAVGVPVGRWLGQGTYRKPDEEAMALPGTRWWVAPALGVVWAALTWRLLAAAPAIGAGPMLDPGVRPGSHGRPSSWPG